ncbi:MAG: HAMP domain-containing histidine kinase [Gammaproteobacteria bacterium]|nr:HAMP domain-containing histidine kinase [Planctomycetota bacterium]MCB1746306.1 HAMP domain-containing histidine kinase [Gammaproteobacteria bacterium]MCP5199591.1 HAMP domain-containing histidine kinase [Gammaproteobacteria bacterium]
MNTPAELIVCDARGHRLAADDAAWRRLAADGLLDAAGERLRLDDGDGVPRVPGDGDGPFLQWVPVTRDGAAAWLVHIDAARATTLLLDATRAIVLRALGEGLVHKLRSPLNAIALNAEMLQYSAQAPTRDEQRRARYLEAIGGEVRRLAEAVDLFADLLDGGAGGAATTEIGGLLDQVRRFAVPALHGRQVELQVDAAPRGVSLAISEARALLAVLALTVAAGEQAAPGTTLVITAHAGDGTTAIELHCEGSVAPAAGHLARGEQAALLQAAARLAADADGVLDLGSNGTLATLHLPRAPAA